MAIFPSSEVVAVAWLKTLAGVPSGVATSLPSDSASFAANGFVQVTIVGGTPDKYTSMQAPVLQIDCWAYNANSVTKPPWGKALSIADNIKSGAFACAGSDVTTPAAFDNASIREATILTHPRRITDPNGAMARFSMDLILYYTPVPKS